MNVNEILGQKIKEEEIISAQTAAAGIADAEAAADFSFDSFGGYKAYSDMHGDTPAVGELTPDGRLSINGNVAVDSEAYGYCAADTPETKARRSHSTDEDGEPMPATDNGNATGQGIDFMSAPVNETNTNKCVQNQNRYRNFDGCASTVEANSWCTANDACYDTAIVYKDLGMNCTRAW